MQRPERSSQETIGQTWGRVLVPAQGIYINNISEPFRRTKPPQQMEELHDGAVFIPGRRTTRTSPGATKYQI